MNRTEILAAFAAEPWAILPSVLDAMRALVASLPEQPSEDDLARLRAYSLRPVEAPDAGPRQPGPGGVGVIPIRGVLSQRSSLWSLLFGGSSTEGIGRDLRAHLADESVAGIVLDIDSPGGAVAGVPELADAIYAARDVKPIIAVSDTLNASAAYWLASQANEIHVAPSSLTGSIGIIATHVDVSAALAAAGVTVTLVSAGKYKAEGSPFAPLTDEARDHLQSVVDDFYGMFTSAVARGRGVKASDVREGYGEGRIVTATEAVRVGLADRVGGLAEAAARATNPRARLRADGGASEPEPTPGLSNDSYSALARALSS